MSENPTGFYYQEEGGERIPLDRMTRAQCEEVISQMAEEIAYWRRLDAMVLAAMEVEDGRREAKH